MRQFHLAVVLLLAAGFASVPQAQRTPYRTLNDMYEAPRYASLEQRNHRAAYIREHILESAGLMPMPERTPLHAQIFGEVKHPDYTVSKVFFETLPGFYMTGNLYRPIGTGPFPAILSSHGHWTYGRLENTGVVSVPGRAINLARQGFVVFTYDLIGYNDSRQLEHRTFGGPRENMWGLSVGGLQIWNGIRALDFLQELPYVRRDSLAATGASGGGTQTFLLTAIDDRVKVSAPVNMISFHMQGGCVCENPPGLRLDTNNVEIASTIAPRPLLMVSATGDWTNETLEKEYPAIKSVYSLLQAPDRVHAVRFDAPHNYNQNSREAVYAWMARWLKGAPADVKVPETSFTADALQDLLVFHERPLPANALTATQLTDQWIANAKGQLQTASLDELGRSLRHSLGYGDSAAIPAGPKGPALQPKRTTVLVDGSDPALEKQLRSAGFLVKAIAFTPFDRDAASKIQHFETYNRTVASQRVADIVSALAASPGAAIVASSDAALAAIFASAIVPPRIAILAPGDFDTSNDDDFVRRLYVPGLRRAGDLATAARIAGARLVIHDSGLHFVLPGVAAQDAKLTPRDIIARLRAAR